MKRSGFPRRTYTRAPVVHTPVVRQGVYAPATGGIAIPKPDPVRPGKRTPTVEEARWMNAITALGCIACRIDGWHGSPGTVHHLLRGGLRIGHLHTICLCDPGHHQGGQAKGVISRHPYKARFERKYGTELYLLDLSRELVGSQRNTDHNQPEGHP